MENELLVTMKVLDFENLVRRIVRECVGASASTSASAPRTVSFVDINEIYGVSAPTCLRMMRAGEFPQPVDSRTKEYRFDASEVAATFAKKYETARDLAIRPDKRRDQMIKAKAKNKA